MRQHAPGRGIHGGCKAELMAQVAMLLLQFEVIIICFCKGLFEQPCLSEEEGFYLEKVVAMLRHGSEIEPACPEFEGIAIESEAIIACQGGEKTGFPIAFVAI